MRDMKRHLRGEEVSGNGGGGNEHMIWLGDFNRHHLKWDKEWNNHLFTRANLDEAQMLLKAVASYDLTMALPKGVPTLVLMATGNYT